MISSIFNNSFSTEDNSHVLHIKTYRINMLRIHGVSIVLCFVNMLVSVVIFVPP